MTIQDLLPKTKRILDAFDFQQSGGIYPAGCTNEQARMLDADKKFILDRYKELRQKVGFQEAMRTAKADYVLHILSSDAPCDQEGCYFNAGGDQCILDECQ